MAQQPEGKCMWCGRENSGDKYLDTDLRVVTAWRPTEHIHSACVLTMQNAALALIDTLPA